VSEHRPPDVEGECNAWAQIADDHGDNDCTFRCKLPEGHEGWHEEAFGPAGDQKWLRWEKDKRPEVEAEDAQERGRDDGYDDEPVPHEAGEDYLAAFCVAVEEHEERAQRKKECAEDIKRALLLACERAQCDDECPAKRGCYHVCRTCGEEATGRCDFCRLWLCYDHDMPHGSLCPSRPVAK